MATKHCEGQACHPARALWNQSTLTGTVFAFGIIVNLLLLTGPFFALQVYDRVLTSRSVETLAALCVLMVILFAAMGVLDHLRRRIAARAAERFSSQMEYLLPASHKAGTPPQSTIRHLETLRHFFGSAVFMALLDLPWFPVFALVLWFFHPVLALLAIGGAAFYLLVGGLRLISPAPHTQTGQAELWAASVLSDPDLAAAMGGQEACANKWRKLRIRARSAALKMADRQAMLASLAQTARLILQSLIVALSAYLVIKGQLSPGAIIASSVLLARAFGPLDILVQNAPHIRAAVAAWRQISKHPGLAKTSLQLPTRNKEHGLEVRQITVFPPSSRQAALRLVDFQLLPGQMLSVHGPSGSGKTMLARALAGIIPVAGGQIRIGGTPPCRLAQAKGGIGYLPQMPRLAPVSIAQNIGGLSADVRDAQTMRQIVRAAQLAGADKRILALDAGYATLAQPGPIPPGLIRQIALARAICHDPWLLILDEPTAELDEPATAALSQYIDGLRASGAMIVMLSQFPDPLALADLRLNLNAGLSHGAVPCARNRTIAQQGRAIGGIR